MISEFTKEKIFWTRKMNLKLVKFVERKPNIWNSTHSKYTSVDLRDQTYAEFASKYGDDFSGQAVKQRWTNIRSTFAYYLRKVKSSEEKGENYNVTWHLWEACQFLQKSNKKVDINGDEDCSGSEGENTNVKIERYSSPSEDVSSSDEAQTQTKTTDNCKAFAKELVNVFKGVQNDAFGLDNTKYGKVGRKVARKLSEMSSYDAASASQKIMEILLLYDDGNPSNPNFMK